MSIPETVSEKPRRGRPRSHARNVLEQELGTVIGGGTLRTRLAGVYWFRTVALVDQLLGDDDQRVLLGGASRDLRSGVAAPSRRAHGFAVEFGRWVAYLGLDDELDGDEIREHLVEVARLVREKQVTFSQAAAHYRKNRLGERAGTAFALAKHLARSLDAYLRKFPATPGREVEQAIERLAAVAVIREEPTP